MIQLFPKISGNFQGRSEEFQSSEEDPSPRLSSFKTSEPGIRSVILIHGLFFSQIGSSLHFPVVNVSFKAY